MTRPMVVTLRGRGRAVRLSGERCVAWGEVLGVRGRVKMRGEYRELFMLHEG